MPSHFSRRLDDLTNLFWISDGPVKVKVSFGFGNGKPDKSFESSGKRKARTGSDIESGKRDRSDMHVKLGGPEDVLSDSFNTGEAF